MSTLYIHLPCKATADLAPRWSDLACPYALVSDNGTIEREAITPLMAATDAIAMAQRVVLLLAASDVTLLQVTLPPLSSTKLKAALPNLVEDQLLENPAESVIVAGEVSQGLRTVAVVQRAWLERIQQTFVTLGAKQIVALPAQLCLPHQTGHVVAAIKQHTNYADLTLRTGAQTGMGLAIISNKPDFPIGLNTPSPIEGEGWDGGDSVANTSSSTPTLTLPLHGGGDNSASGLFEINALAPNQPITLYVSQASLAVYQAALHGNTQYSLAADNWSQWITGARGATLNLLAGINTESSFSIDYKKWRWPLILLSAVLIGNIAAVNFDWWQLASEAKNLRGSLTKIYQARYPKETVIIDPIAQMQQKINLAKRSAGLAAPDDFTALAAAFGEAWSSATHTATSATIATLEYRERSLFVTLKNNSPDNEVLVQQLQATLANHHLTLAVVSDPSNAVVWKIQSAR